MYILKAYIKFGNLFHLTWKKKGNLRQVISFMNKKVNLGVLVVSSYYSNGIPQSCLDPNGIAKHVIKNHKIFNTLNQTSDFNTIQNTSSQIYYL
jgi:hypothetical protein